jgi:hypothetical protein
VLRTNTRAKGVLRMKPRKSLFVGALVIQAALTSQARAMNGYEWYSTCNQWLHTSEDQMKALSPESKVAYRACQIEAVRVYCDLNYEGDAREVGKNASDETKRQWHKQLLSFCPNYNMSRMPNGGPPVYAVKALEREGGPGTFEGYMPASWMLKRVFQKIFPGCDREREKLGFVNDPQACFNSWVK